MRYVGEPVILDRAISLQEHAILVPKGTTGIVVGFAWGEIHIQLDRHYKELAETGNVICLYASECREAVRPYRQAPVPDHGEIMVAGAYRLA